MTFLKAKTLIKSLDKQGLFNEILNLKTVVLDDTRTSIFLMGNEDLSLPESYQNKNLVNPKLGKLAEPKLFAAIQSISFGSGLELMFARRPGSSDTEWTQSCHWWCHQQPPLPSHTLTQSIKCAKVTLVISIVFKFDDSMHSCLKLFRSFFWSFLRMLSPNIFFTNSDQKHANKLMRF